MASKIQWTDETANWVVGCSKISAGCKNCYAATAANSARLQKFDQYSKVVDGNGNWNGHIEFVPKVLDGLLKGKKQRRVFTPSMSDPFHPAVKDEWLDRFLAVVALTPHITYQCLTKRPERMHEYFDWCERRRIAEGKSFSFCRVDKVEQVCREIENYPHFNIPEWPLPNLHLGVSVENQAAADERIHWLLRTPAAKRFLSVEPLLEDIDFAETSYRIVEDVMFRPPSDSFREWVLTQGSWEDFSCTNWVDLCIVGGESGPGARPFHLEWARSLLAQCRDSGTAFFLKQVGSNPFLGGEPLKLKDRKGGDMEEWPEDLRARELI
jgi:protein gp37